MAVYFIRDELSGLVKIGYSDSPALRMSKMQSDCPGKLTLLGVIDGDQRVEARCHDECRSARIRGEWFEESDAVRELIATAALPNDVRSRRCISPRSALISRLASATGAPENTTRFWVKHGRVPGRHVLATVRSGVFHMEQICDALWVNGRLNKGRPPAVLLEDIAILGEAA